MKKKAKAVHLNPIPVIREGKWVTEIQRRDVRVLAVAEGYAMVRLKGAAPYVAPLKQLQF